MSKTVDKLMYKVGAEAFYACGGDYDEFKQLFIDFSKEIKKKEREKFCSLLRQVHDVFSLQSLEDQLK